MFGLRSLSLFVAIAVCGLNSHAPSFAMAQAPEAAAAATRHLRAQHNGEDHTGGLLSSGQATQTNAISPGGGDVNPSTGVKNPGGILGPLYAAFPQLLAPLAMASDTIHNSNAAVSGVQHTPDGIFQA